MLGPTQEKVPTIIRNIDNSIERLELAIHDLKIVKERILR